MKGAIFSISRIIALIIAVVVCFTLASVGEWLRALSMLVSAYLFLHYSKLSEQRHGFSIGYLFVFMIVYVTNSAIACAYTDERMRELSSVGEFGYWMGDNYGIYFVVTTIFYLILIFYLHRSTPFVLRSVRCSDLTESDRTGLDIGAIVLAVCALLFDSYEFTLPVFVYFFMRLISDGKNKVFSAVVLILLFFVFPESILYRYRAVCIILPVMMMYLIRKPEKKMPLWTSVLISVAVVAMMALYGIISECYKLHYSFSEVMRDEYYRSYFFRHQIYRVFSIWIKLGGYIIYHVQTYGFFYGATYVKSIINLLGGDGPSLPKIAAYYDDAVYAQPGILAEGYANYGIIGAVLNLCLVYFLMEWLHKRYISNPTYSTLFFATIPFTQILLDGGTFNSAFYLIVVLIVFHLPKAMLKHDSPIFLRSYQIKKHSVRYD